MEMCRLERRRSRGREGLPPDGLVGDHGSSARLSMLLIDSATPRRRSRRDPGKVSKALRAQRMTPGPAVPVSGSARSASTSRIGEEWIRHWSEP
jgi:hypothetical protein